MDEYIVLDMTLAALKAHVGAVSSTEAEELRLTIEDAIVRREADKVNIKGQLAAATQERTTAEDRDWRRRATAALQIKGQQIQKLQRALGIVARHIRATRAVTQDKAFIVNFCRAVKRAVGEEAYTELVREAQAAQEQDTAEGVE